VASFRSHTPSLQHSFRKGTYIGPHVLQRAFWKGKIVILPPSPHPTHCLQRSFRKGRMLVLLYTLLPSRRGSFHVAPYFPFIPDMFARRNVYHTGQCTALPLSEAHKSYEHFTSMATTLPANNIKSLTASTVVSAVSPTRLHGLSSVLSFLLNLHLSQDSQRVVGSFAAEGRSSTSDLSFAGSSESRFRLGVKTLVDSSLQTRNGCELC
jgi:hypothetical protein